MSVSEVMYITSRTCSYSGSADNRGGLNGNSENWILSSVSLDVLV